MLINSLNINIDIEFILLFRLLIKFFIKYHELYFNSIREYRPYMKPNTEIIEKENDKILIQKKNIIKEWLSYFYIFRKRIEAKFRPDLNPINLEFIKYYDVCKKNNSVIGRLKNYIKDVEKNNENKILDIVKNITFKIMVQIHTLNINHNSTSKYNITLNLKLTNIYLQYLIDSNKSKFNFSILNVSFTPKKTFIKENNIDNINLKTNIIYNQDSNIKYNNHSHKLIKNIF